MRLHSAPWPTLILVAVLFLAFGELRAQQTRTKVV